MRRVSALLRPKLPIRCVQPAALRPTRVLHIPPQLARLIVAGGLLLFQAFMTAHNREAKKLREEEASRNGGLKDGSRNSAVMPSSEALQILGLDSSLHVPLQSEKDRAEATRRFKHLFAIAKENNNVYLQGKFSAAYKQCVNVNWDADEQPSSTDETTGSAGIKD